MSAVWHSHCLDDLIGYKVGILSADDHWSLFTNAWHLMMGDVVRVTEWAFWGSWDGGRWCYLHLWHCVLQVWWIDTVCTRHLALLCLSRCTDTLLSGVPLFAQPRPAPLRCAVQTTCQLTECNSVPMPRHSVIVISSLSENWSWIGLNESRDPCI